MRCPISQVLSIIYEVLDVASFWLHDRSMKDTILNGVHASLFMEGINESLRNHEHHPPVEITNVEIAARCLVVTMAQCPQQGISFWTPWNSFIASHLGDTLHTMHSGNWKWKFWGTDRLVHVLGELKSCSSRSEYLHKLGSLGMGGKEIFASNTRSARTSNAANHFEVTTSSHLCHISGALVAHSY